jgi:hypothetical protein
MGFFLHKNELKYLRVAVEDSGAGGGDNYPEPG